MTEEEKPQGNDNEYLSCDETNDGFNSDGSLKCDVWGNPIITYDQRRGI